MISSPHIPGDTAVSLLVVQRASVPKKLQLRFTHNLSWYGRGQAFREGVNVPYKVHSWLLDHEQLQKVVSVQMRGGLHTCFPGPPWQTCSAQISSDVHFVSGKQLSTSQEIAKRTISWAACCPVMQIYHSPPRPLPICSEAEAEVRDIVRLRGPVFVWVT